MFNISSPTSSRVKVAFEKCENSKVNDRVYTIFSNISGDYAHETIDYVVANIEIEDIAYCKAEMKIAHKDNYEIMKKRSFEVIE